MFIDTHAHVNFEGFKEDAEEVILRALEAGVCVVNVGTQIDTSRQAVEMAKKFAEITPQNPLFRKEGEENAGEVITPSNSPSARGRMPLGVYAVIGIHPVHTYSQDLVEEETHFKTRAEQFDHKVYLELGKNPLVVGIGECGLDYFRIKNEELPARHLLEPQATAGGGIKNVETIKKAQKDSFISQIRLAKELDKALVVHTRSSKGTDDACLDTLEILKSEISNPSQPPLMQRGGDLQTPSFQELALSLPNGRGQGELNFVLHSYTGSPEVAKKFIELGAYISFNGIITFDKTGNQEAVLREVPNDKILLETDCPFLSPVPVRGKRNEPIFVKHVAEHIAKLKNMSVEEIEKVTTENARRFYNI